MIKTHIAELIEKKSYKQLKDEMAQYNAVDIAETLENLVLSDALLAFRMLSKDMAADVFSYFSQEEQAKIIEAATETEVSGLVETLYFDDMIDLLEEMPSNVVKKILRHTKESEREVINQFLNYPDESAGSIMTIEYMALKSQDTVEQAIEHIRQTELDKETIDVCYIITNDRKLLGLVSLRKLVTSDAQTTVGEIMNRDVMFVKTHDDQAEAAYVFKKYDLLVLPVVDAEERLTGIITVDDIVDVIEAENTEDFERMAAMSPSRGGYLHTGVFDLAKNRIIWLLVLMISATFTGRIIQRYENVLQSIVILAAFIPMLMDTGGNAGAQSSTLIIRGLALGEIGKQDVLKVIWKEIRVSFVVGVALCGINFIRIFYFEQVPLNIAGTVTITLFATIILAKTVGAILPIVANSLKVDPAIMASPLITTIVDAVALIIYFSVASTILGLT